MTLHAGIVGKSTGSISVAVFPPLASYSGAASLDHFIQEVGTGPIFPPLAAYSGATLFDPTVVLNGDGAIVPPLASRSAATLFGVSLEGTGTITPPLAAKSASSGFSPTLEGLGTITPPLAAYSGPTGFSPTIPTIIEPDDIADLELWYDADDSGTITESSGEVSQWDDKSANGEDVVQATAGSRPNTSTVNTNDGIFFDGTGELLRDNSATVNTSPVTIIIVCTPTDVGSGFFFPLNLRDGFTQRIAFTRNASTMTAFADAISGSDLTLDPGSNLTSGTTMMAIARIRDSGDGTSDYVDDQANTDSASGPTTIETVCDDINIGSNANGSNSFTGHIHEIIVYNRFLSDTERDDIEDYLNAKWSIG